MNFYVDIFFRLLNFAALCGIAVYMFKKYVLPVLRIQLASKDAQEEALLSHQAVLESDHSDIDHVISQEEKLCLELHEKVTEWSSVVKKELHDRQEYKKIVTKQLLADQKLQKEYKERDALLNEVLSLAKQQSRKELQARFADPSEQKKFMQSVLQFMQEHTV